MKQGTVKLGTLAGIDIRVHYTWLFAFVLIAWSLAQGYFPTTDTGLGAGTYWVLGIVSALLLFVSVLVHELGHSLVAGARGLRVQSITLFIFGGISSITSEASKAGDEFLVAVVGPVTSLALAGLFWLLLQALPPASAAAAVASYLAFTNLLLAAFNIVPGIPLDGGRVLRAAAGARAERAEWSACEHHDGYVACRRRTLDERARLRVRTHVASRPAGVAGRRRKATDRLDEHHRCQARGTPGVADDAR